jgi:O-antigen ligase
MKFLFWLIVALLAVVGWGKMDVWIAPWLHFALGGGGIGAFRILVVGYLAARVATRDFGLRFGWLRDPIVLLYLLAALSPLWAYANPGWPVRSHDTGDLLSVILPGLVAYLSVRWLLDRGFDRYGFALLRALVVAMTLVALQILVSAPGTLLDFSQVDSFYEHHTHVAMRMVMAIPLTIGFMMHDRRHKPFYVALLVLQIVGLTISNSRIGWIALGVVGLYGAFYAGTPRMRRWFVFALVLGIGLAFSHPQVRANFLTLLNLTHEENFRRRVVVYSTDLELIARRPILGIGFSSRTFLYTGRWIEGETWEYDHPHDLYLQMGVYLGLVGMALFAWVCFAVARAMRAIGRRGPPSMVSGMRGALVAFLVMNVAETALSSERVAFMLAVLLAIIMSWARAGRASGEETVPDRVATPCEATT